jgi:hypothetical protein
MMCHIALLEGDENNDGTSRLEPVPDKQYQAARAD